MAATKPTKRLHKAIIAYSAAGMLIIGVVAALVGILPLYARLKRNERRSLLLALKTRAFAVEECLSRAKDVALQITSRTKARERLEAYNRGEVSREELDEFSRPILEDALKRSDEVVGITRLDQRGSLAVQVGTPIPEDCLGPPKPWAGRAEVEGPIACGGESALVVRAPILDREGARVGTDVVLFRVARLRQIVSDRTGLGRTGETLLGLARRGRAELFFRTSSGAGAASVPVGSSLGAALAKARAGESGVATSEAPGGGSAVMAYGPVRGADWSLVVRVDTSELYAAVDRQIALLAVVVAALILLGVLGMMALLRPLTVRAAARAGDLERKVRQQTAALEAELGERQRAEEALVRESNLLRALIDNMPDYIYVKDTESRFLINNLAHVRILGAASPQECIGKTDFEFFPRDLAEQYFADERRVIQSGQPVINREEPTVDPAGHQRWVSTTKVPLRDGRGEIVGLVGISRDITERKRAVEALRESEERFRLLVQTAPTVIVCLSPEHRILEFNPEAARVYGRRRDDVLGKNYLELFVPESFREAVAADITRVLAGQPTRGFESAASAADGTERVLTWNVDRLLDPQGQPMGVIAVGQDITDRKRAEEALAERSEELARSNAELEQFAYVASHDLLEPLRMVSSYMQLLAQRYGDALEGDAKEFIAYAVDGASRMQQLINDLLMYSRVGMRGQGFRPTSCEAVLGDVLRNLAASIKESGAEVTHDPLPTVMADQTQLLQLFQNLIGNAIKFRRDEPPRVHVAVEPDGGLYRFSVRDNGVGVEPQSAVRIFMIFHRLHARDAYPGTGIGLAICKRIVERHGGRIWVESTPDEGSTFLFTLPAAGEGSTMSDASGPRE